MAAGGALGRRTPLVQLPTALEPLPRLGAALGMDPGALWVKRDDVNGLGGGGNKARKLEYLCADALGRGCDVLVTGGGQQSNHVRMTAAAANRLGLACVVVVPGGPPATATGNVLLHELLGPGIVRLAGGATGRGATKRTGLDYYAIEAAIVATTDRLASEGRRPYGIPIGGASPVGALGYVRAATELLGQAVDAVGVEPDLIVVADGSGGTHAGLSVGVGDHGRVLGIDVGARPDLGEVLAIKTVEVAALAGRPDPAGSPEVDHGQVGRGYAARTDACRDALILAARTEGLLLDPVYTGKAMAGLIAARADGRIGPSTLTVFIHTGGTPGLFASSVGNWLRRGTGQLRRSGPDRSH